MVNDGTELRADEEKVNYAPSVNVCSPGVSAQLQSVVAETEVSDLEGTNTDEGISERVTADVLPSGSPPRDVSSLFGIEEPHVVDEEDTEPPFV